VRALNQLNPSLLISSTGSESNTSARIRGVGTVGDNAGLESSVAIFIDGVYRSRTGVGLNELGEIERVEVLRGPQGTLFGRNASAGLLHIITKKPEFAPHAYGFVTAGNYRYRRAEGGVTGPITQTLAGKIEAVFEKRDGFYEDVNTGADDQRSRPLFRARPIAVGADRHLLGATDRRLSPGGASRAAARCSPPTRWPPAIRRRWIRTSTPPIRVLTLVAPATIDQLYPSLADPYDRKVAVSPGTTFQGRDQGQGRVAGDELGPGRPKLTSITAYRDYSNAQGADAEYNLVDILHIDRDGSARTFKTFSQELRLQGDAFDDKLDWLIGGFYSREKLSGRQHAEVRRGIRPVRLVPDRQRHQPRPRGRRRAGCLTPTGRACFGRRRLAHRPGPGPAVFDRQHGRRRHGLSPDQQERGAVHAQHHPPDPDDRPDPGRPLHPRGQGLLGRLPQHQHRLPAGPRPAGRLPASSPWPARAIRPPSSTA
jgi:iron complex outermembrane receptor protein